MWLGVVFLPPVLCALVRIFAESSSISPSWSHKEHQASAQRPDEVFISAHLSALTIVVCFKDLYLYMCLVFFCFWVIQGKNEKWSHTKQFPLFFFSFITKLSHLWVSEFKCPWLRTWLHPHLCVWASVGGNVVRSGGPHTFTGPLFLLYSITLSSPVESSDMACTFGGMLSSCKSVVCLREQAGTPPRGTAGARWLLARTGGWNRAQRSLSNYRR